MGKVVSGKGTKGVGGVVDRRDGCVAAGRRHPMVMSLVGRGCEFGLIFIILIIVIILKENGNG